MGMAYGKGQPWAVVPSQGLWPGLRAAQVLCPFYAGMIPLVLNTLNICVPYDLWSLTFLKGRGFVG